MDEELRIRNKDLQQGSHARLSAPKSVSVSWKPYSSP